MEKIMKNIMKNIIFMYSHLSNKREVTLIDFEKFHPTQKKIPPPRLLISLQNFPIFLQNLMTIFLTVILQ